MSFADLALAEIDGLHRVLQRWFRAEGEQDAGAVLAHFDPGYTMVTTAGKRLALADFRSGLSGFWGSRPGLLMEITDETLLHTGPGAALMTYNERQTLDGHVTNRLSTVFMLESAGMPVWRHLQETMIA